MTFHSVLYCCYFQSKAIGDRIVIVSNSTQVLDIVQGLCIAKRFSSCRLDGKTDSDKRQPMVRALLRVRHSVAIYGLLLLYCVICVQSMREKAQPHVRPSSACTFFGASALQLQPALVAAFTFPAFNF